MFLPLLLPPKYLFFYFYGLDPGLLFLTSPGFTLYTEKAFGIFLVE
jgi:hypothetical protein